MLIIIAIYAGRTNDPAQNKTAANPPTIHPMRGKYIEALFKYSSEWLIHLGTGILVKNITAVKNI